MPDYYTGGTKPDKPEPQNFAGGGQTSGSNAPWFSGYGNTGFLGTDTPGRTDILPVKVPQDSYVIPADVVSGLGQGNSNNGKGVMNQLMNHYANKYAQQGIDNLISPSQGASAASAPNATSTPAALVQPTVQPGADSAFSSGASAGQIGSDAGSAISGLGADTAGSAAGSGLAAGAGDAAGAAGASAAGAAGADAAGAAGASLAGAGAADAAGEGAGMGLTSLFALFASGGRTSEKNHVDIIAAGGEYIVPPHVVRAIGGGDVRKGHKHLDDFVKHIRARTIKQLKTMPNPVGSSKK